MRRSRHQTKPETRRMMGVIMEALKLKTVDVAFSVECHDAGVCSQLVIPPFAGQVLDFGYVFGE